jgi:hypothetical protein
MSYATVPTPVSAAQQRSWRLERTRCAQRSMTETSPENDVWLRALLRRSPLLSDAALRRHWRNLVPWLPVAARYELAAILLEVERAVACA